MEAGRGRPLIILPRKEPIRAPAPEAQPGVSVSPVEDFPLFTHSSLQMMPPQDPSSSSSGGPKPAPPSVPRAKHQKPNTPAPPPPVSPVSSNPASFTEGRAKHAAEALWQLQRMYWDGSTPPAAPGPPHNGS